MTDLRFQELTDWCKNELLNDNLQLEVVSGDASFRRYFRTCNVNGAVQTRQLIAVDAPPDKENSSAFVAIARTFLSHGVLVPAIISTDLDQGFMLLEDFGNSLLLASLNDTTVDHHYHQAMDSLLHLKDCTEISAYQLPDYDEKMLQNEMLLFSDWFLGKHLNINSDSELTTIFDCLVQSALQQPQVCVHRDFHSRNLMLLDSGELGIIDFQDAVLGPITYDLVSLLKDCYISWPRNRVLGWLEDYYNLITAQQISGLGDLQQFIRWFDLMGMQRHFKAVGIFARLNHRDNKPDYLADIPRTLDYIYQCCLLYPEFKSFAQTIKEDILPALQHKKND